MKIKCIILTAVLAVCVCGVLFLCGCEPTDEPWPEIGVPNETDPSLVAHRDDMPSLRELPEVYIRTVGNADIDSKEVYTNCAVGLVARSQEEATWYRAQIRLRGNSSLSGDKKPYRIRFDDRITPFGLGSGGARSWVLLAEYADYSMMRDYSALDFAKYVYADDYYAPQAMFVSVYLNGSYAGMYLLTEQIQIQENRIDLPESGARPGQCGYLLELEQSDTRWEDTTDGLDRFTVRDATGQDICFVIKNDNPTAEMNEYIRSRVQKVYDAVSTGDHDAVRQLVDTESAARAYLVQMVGDDPDSNLSSMFFYLPPNGKFTFGPAWDFDYAMGNYCTLSDPEQTVMNDLLSDLWQIPQIRSRVCELWAELRKPDGYFDSFFAHLQSEVTRLRPEIDRNFDRWQVFGTRVTEWQSPKTEQLRNYDDAYADFLAWYHARIAYLDTVFVPN